MAFPLIRSLATGLQLSSCSRLFPPEVRMLAPVQWSQAYHWLPVMRVFVSVRVGAGPPKEPLKIAEGAQSGPLLLAMVELVIVILPSVWKIAPPCQPVDVFPLIVLSTILKLPSERMPPPTS